MQKGKIKMFILLWISTQRSFTCWWKAYE